MGLGDEGALSAHRIDTTLVREEPECLSHRHATRGMGNHQRLEPVSYGLPGEVGEVVVVRNPPLVPAGFAEGRHVSEDEDG